MGTILHPCLPVVVAGAEVVDSVEALPGAGSPWVMIQLVFGPAKHWVLSCLVWSSQLGRKRH